MKVAATVVYAFLVGAGGVVGFIKAGSYASLVMGLIFAMLLLISAIAMYKKSVLAHFSAVFLTSLLTSFFAYRFLITQAVMPAGLMLFLGVCMIVILSIKRKLPLSNARS